MHYSSIYMDLDVWRHSLLKVSIGHIKSHWKANSLNLKDKPSLMFIYDRYISIKQLNMQGRTPYLNRIVKEKL